MEWKQIYGKVFTLWLGNIPMVNVNDYKLATELFVHQGSNFEEREPMQMFAKAARGGLYGKIFICNFAFLPQGFLIKYKFRF